MAIKTVGAKRLQGLKSDRVAGAPPTYNPAWVEVGRTTLTSDGSVGGSMTVSSIPTKYRYLQCLYNLQDGSAGNVMMLGRINGSGNNYEEKGVDINGSSDARFAYGSQAYWNMGLADGSYDSFGIQHITNYNGEARRSIYNECVHNGSGNNPKARRHFGYRGDTSNTTQVEAWSYGSGRAFGNGSELVVLGLDPAGSAESEGFWKYLGGNTLTGTSDNLTTGTIAAKKYLWMQGYVKATGSVRMNLTFNNDAGSNQYKRTQQKDSSQSSSYTDNCVDLHASMRDLYFVNAYICNNASAESLIFYDVVSVDGVSSNSATIPSRIWGCAKWLNSSNQITEIDITNNNSGQDYSAKSFIKVWGSD